MKKLFLLTDCWPNSTMNHSYDSVGLVTEDEAVAKAWVELDPHFHGYNEVMVVENVQELMVTKQARVA